MHLNGLRTFIVLTVGLCASFGPAAPARAADPIIEEFKKKLAELEPGDPDSRVQLGKWCESKKQTHMAMHLYRLALKLDAKHEAAYEALYELSLKTSQPTDEDRQTALLRQFGEGFSLFASPNFLIIYDTSEDWAKSRAAMLENVLINFYKTFHAAGFRPMPLEDRLVCVIFRDHVDYQKYAARVDGINVPWASGYYSRLSNRIAFFNNDSSPEMLKMRREISDQQSLVTQLSIMEQRAQAARNQSQVNIYRKRRLAADRKLRTMRRRFDQSVGLNNISKTYHEVAHQLAFNSGVQSRRANYPFWVSEGIATCFETLSPAMQFGPSRDNRSRRHTINQTSGEDTWIPLSELVGAVKAPDVDKDGRSLLYAESWALFHFLFVNRLTDLRNYLQEISTQPRAAPEPHAMRRLFEKHFGPIPEVEAQLKKYLRETRTPRS